MALLKYIAKQYKGQLPLFECLLCAKVLGVLYSLPLVLKVTLLGRWYSHFPGEEMEVQN